MALLAAGIFMQQQVHAQEPAVKHEFTIAQCVEYANKNNALVKNALTEYKVQQQVNRNVTAAAYPTITASAATQINPNVGVQVFPHFIAAGVYGVLTGEGVKDGDGNPIEAPADFGYINAQFGSKWNANVGVSLSQILFDGQVFVGLQARDAVLDFQAKNIAVTEETIKSNIYKIYYQLVIANKQVQVVDNNIDLLSKLLRDTKELYKNGFVEKLDVDKTTVQLNNLQTEKQKILNTISNGYLGLKLLMGMPVSEELVLTEKIDESGIKSNLLDDSAYKYDDRAEYQYAQVGKTLNEYNIRRYKLAQIPSVYLNSAFNKSAQRNEFSFFGKGSWFTQSYIGVSINATLFSGFYKKSNIEQAKLALEKTNTSIDALKLQIDNEVAAAKINYTNAVLTMDAQKQNQELAQQVYNQARKKYDAGTGSQLEITQAQTDLRTAENNYITAMYNAALAKVDYLKAIGKLP